MNKEDLAISIYELDKHLEQQASLLGKVAEEYAEVMNERDEIKVKLERLEAELDSKYRQQAEEKGKKVTEKVIASQIKQDSEYVKLMEKFLDVQGDLNFLMAEKQALEYKKKSLEGLVQLYVSDYFSDMKGGDIPKEKVNEFKSMKAEREQEENRQKLQKRLKKAKV